MATHLSVLPQSLLQLVDASTQSPPLRYLRLPHPRTNVPCLFLPFQTGAESAILELQSINPDASRSWFMNNSHIVSDGKLLLHTPIDPAFLLLPLLQSIASSKDIAQQFRPVEDIFEAIASRLTINADDVQLGSSERPQHDVLALAKLRCVHDGMRRICDFKDVTEDITAYRFSEEKALQYARAKVEHLATPALFDGFRSLRNVLAQECLLDLDESKQELVQSARVRAACSLVSSYLPPDIAETLQSSYDFSAVEAFTRSLKSEVDLGTMIKAKRTNSNTFEDEFDSADKDKDNKKRKAADQGGRNVAKLAKVNTKGMTKLSTFFGKK